MAPQNEFSERHRHLGVYESLRRELKRNITEVVCKMFANVANESCLRGSQQTMQSYRYYESDTTIFLMSYQMK